MNLDGLSLSFLKEELYERLINARIDKIYQIDHSTICIYLYVKNEKQYLVISTSLPIMYFVQNAPQHLETPTSFCMVLRKHLEGARITDVRQYELDRIINIQVDTIGFANQLESKNLYVELTGKNSNIILLKDNIIIQALKNVALKNNSFRQIQPNREYVLPPQKHTPYNLVKNNSADFITASKSDTAAVVLHKFLLANFAGIGTVISREIVWRCGFLDNIATTELTEKDWQELEKNIVGIKAEINLRKGYYCYTKAGRFVAFAPFRLFSQQANTQEQVFPSVLAAINYLLQLTPAAVPEKIFLEKLLKNEIDKQERKKIALEAEKTVAENAEQYKIWADNLMAYLYSIEPKSNKYQGLDIYSNQPITIVLEARLSPLENANAYYKKYNKAKRANVVLVEQIQQTSEQIFYLQSLEIALDNVSSNEEIQELKIELEVLGLFKAAKKTKNKTKKTLSNPWKFRVDADTVIYVGKNNQQNDQLTFKIAKTNDLWFHVQKLPGSHVVIKKTSGQPAATEIQLAAELALYFSKGKNSSNVPVDYTQRKNVWKANGAKPGLVYYDKQSTLYLTLDVAKIEEFIKTNKTND